MKNVYLYIVFLLIGGKSLGQDLQNANWYYGDYGGLTFLPNINLPVPLNNSALPAFETCATVSDDNGNLLFYTDGRIVYNRLHNPMPNGTGLKGHHSSTQGSLIVHKPNSNRYFIITMDGISGVQNGLYSYEVDMNLDNGNGDVIASTKHTPLKDHVGSNIDYIYRNRSEKLTSTTHGNGQDYWVVAQIKDYIYSYLVSSSGLTTSPVVSTAPVDSYGVGLDNRGMGCMKISPDSNHIAICYYELGYEADGGILVGDFNNTTGEANFNQDIITMENEIFYGVEFSASGYYIYFSTLHKTASVNGEIRLYKMDNLGMQLSLLATIPNTYVQFPDPSNVANLQLAINDKIYVTMQTNFAASSYLSIINHPDNFVNPNFQSYSVLGAGYQKIGLPQWVHKIHCPENLILYSPIHDVLNFGFDKKQASQTISCSNTINDNSIAIYHAGETVLLTSGFHSDSGSVFRGYIEGCTGEFEGLIAGGDEYQSMMIQGDVALFSLAPNPATESVSITSDNIMANVTVTSMQGTVLFSRDVKANSYELNISNYIKGFYVVTVTTEDGQIETQKLIKE